MFSCTNNRNEGTFRWDVPLHQKTGTRVPKPPFYETALLLPLEDKGSRLGATTKTNKQTNKQTKHTHTHTQTHTHTHTHARA